MDVSKFIGEATGRLVQDGGRTHFVPFDLPPHWEVPRQLWPQVVEANRQLTLLEGVGRYLPNPAILLRPVVDRESIQSSRIEGTYATAREYLLFELAPRDATSEQDPINDQKGVHNYRKALERATTSALPLSNRLIRDLHRELLTGVRGRDRAPGEFRRVPVAIGSPTTTRFVPPPAGQVVECINKLEQYLHQEPRAFDPLVDCFLVHYQFETIHPFMDGNGRVGRMLLVLMIQRLCGLTKPWLHMSQYFATHKDEYVDGLFNVSAKGDWTSWIDFCLQGVIQQCQETIARCDKLREIKQRFEEIVRTSKGSSRLLQIVEMVFNHPFISIVDFAQKLGVHYQTAQSDLERLTATGILRELPRHRPKTYFAPEVFNVGYEDLGSAEE